MGEHYCYYIVGSPDDGFKSAEIYADTKRTRYLGRVFELSDGWYVEADDLSKLKDSIFIETVLRSRDELLHYINRQGAEFPEDWSVGAISLWLMQRDDGKGFTL